MEEDRALGVLHCSYWMHGPLHCIEIKQGHGPRVQQPTGDPRPEGGRADDVGLMSRKRPARSGRAAVGLGRREAFRQ